MFACLHPCTAHGIYNYHLNRAKYPWRMDRTDRMRDAHSHFCIALIRAWVQKHIVHDFLVIYLDRCRHTSISHSYTHTTRYSLSSTLTLGGQKIVSFKHQQNASQESKKQSKDEREVATFMEEGSRRVNLLLFQNISLYYIRWCKFEPTTIPILNIQSSNEMWPVSNWM